MDRTKAGSYSCCSCRIVVEFGEDCPVAVEGVGGERRGGGLRGVRDGCDRKAVEGADEGTVKESLRIFVNTEKASSRRAIAWSLVGTKSCKKYKHECYIN